MYIAHVLVHMYHRLMTGTGFLGYAKYDEGKYCTVLVTNNHVITNFDDAMGSRFVFENVYPDSKITLRGSDIFVQDFFRCSPMTQVNKNDILHTKS